MIRIAVCDDFKDTVNQVDGYLSEYQQLRDRKLDIKSFFQRRGSVGIFKEKSL